MFLWLYPNSRSGQMIAQWLGVFFFIFGKLQHQTVISVRTKMHTYVWKFKNSLGIFQLQMPKTYDFHFCYFEILLRALAR